MIKVTNATKKFDNFIALDNISCTIPDGCIYGMVGSNGAGKSTLLRLMTGVYKVDSGSITIDDEDVYTSTHIKNNIMYVPDELFFLPNASLDRMASFYNSIYTGYDMDYFIKLTDIFKLNRKKPISSFSKGMKRQAATILALAQKPKYFFFDETFDGLDPVMRNLVKGLICEHVIEHKSTAIITSHSLRELEDTCDQLALLHKGGIVLQSDIGNLKTSLFKVQIAFNKEYDRDLFKNVENSEGIGFLNFLKRGSVSTIIIRGDKDSIVAKLKLLSPDILDILPLTLEEVFTYEMQALGYNFDKVLEEIAGEN